MSVEQKRSFYNERRKRMKRPRILFILALIILVIPFTNYTGMALKRDLSPFDPLKVFLVLSIREYIFLFSSFFAGLGLLLIRRWGWWLFVSAATLFIVHNFYNFFMYTSSWKPGAILHTGLIIFALGYFLRKDIYMPYLQIHRHGWRLLKRYNLTIDMLINGEKKETQNISNGGCFVHWEDCPLEDSEEVTLEFSLGEAAFNLKGGVAATNSSGAGIAFRDMKPEDIQRIKKALQKFSDNG